MLFPKSEKIQVYIPVQLSATEISEDVDFMQWVDATEVIRWDDCSAVVTVKVADRLNEVQAGPGYWRRVPTGFQKPDGETP